MLLTLSAGCSKPGYFTVKGDIPDLADKPVKLVIYNSDSVKTLTTQAVNGRFMFRGSSTDYAVAVISAMSSGPSARFIVRNGDKITLSGLSIDSLTVRGSKPNEKIEAFLAENPNLFSSFYSSQASAMPANVSAANKAIADYVDREGTTPAAAFLVAVYYTPTVNPTEAAALLNRFEASADTRSLLASMTEAVKNEINTAGKARVHSFNSPAYGDSTLRYSTAAQSYTILAFTSAETAAQRRNIVDVLSELSQVYPRRSLRIIELSVCGDSATWKSVVQRDTIATWPRILLPGGAASLSIRHLDIAQPPFYILADSTGRQVYRGHSLAAASDSLDLRLR